MCGICGIINFNNEYVVEEKVRIMMRAMKHRGPDDEGLFLDKNIGLGFVRLSILDLSVAGHQPMIVNGERLAVSREGLAVSSKGLAVNDERLAVSRERLAVNGERLTVSSKGLAVNRGRYVIVYNGEVYNYIEIREELKAKGYVFRSNTDTEVVINSYIEWGEDCLHKFNGMWAFCIYDREKKELFFARDRYGVKPFYYFKDNERFIFASEIPPILSVLNQKPGINNQSVFDYLVFNRTDQTENTFFEGIKKLQHSHFMKINPVNDDIQIKKWYNLRERIENNRELLSGMNETDCIGNYRDLLSSAIGLRLRSDVPVGVCLSGGLDSSSIVSVLLNDYNKSDLNTFSAVYKKGESGDETEFINEYRGLVGNMHYINPNGGTLFDDMKIFVRAQGEPVPSTSPYAQFKVMELAKGNVVVTLDGQGADEQLAGYHYFYGYLFKDLLKKLNFFRFSSEVFNYLKIHRSLFGVKSFLYFSIPGKFKSSVRVNEKGYLNSDFINSYSANNAITDSIYASGSLNDALFDHFEYKLEHLLKWEDRNSMWHSLESRVPFLDYRLVEFTLSLRDNYKIRNGVTKYILRESMKNTLPAKIRRRQDKIGFGTPAEKWFKSPNFNSYVKTIINEGYFFNNGVLNKVNAQKLFDEHLNGKRDINKEIWKWINLELWYREFCEL